MSIEVHLDWERATHLVGALHSATHGSSVTFEYGTGWLARPKAFAPQLRMSAGSISAYASAFEHPLLQEASKLTG